MVKQAKLHSIKIRCPKTNKLVNIPGAIVEMGANAADDDCEMCGSHGYVRIDIDKCPSCGKRHDIELSSW